MISTPSVTSGYSFVDCKHLHICVFVNGKTGKKAPEMNSSVEGENHSQGRSAD